MPVFMVLAVCQSVLHFKSPYDRQKIEAPGRIFPAGLFLFCLHSKQVIYHHNERAEYGGKDIPAADDPAGYERLMQFICYAVKQAEAQYADIDPNGSGSGEIGSSSKKTGESKGGVTDDVKKFVESKPLWIPA